MRPTAEPGEKATDAGGPATSRPVTAAAAVAGAAIPAVRPRPLPGLLPPRPPFLAGAYFKGVAAGSPHDVWAVGARPAGHQGHQPPLVRPDPRPPPLLAWE